MIKHSIEINRPAEEVFAYLEQVDRHNEWQGSLVSTTVVPRWGICDAQRHDRFQSGVGALGPSLATVRSSVGFAGLMPPGAVERRAATASGFRTRDAEVTRRSSFPSVSTHA